LVDRGQVSGLHHVPLSAELAIVLISCWYLIM
jgi:hypothetical protein